MGNIQVTGIVIENFRETEPGVWSFDVKGIDSHTMESPVMEEMFVDQQQTPTTSPTTSPTKLPTTSPTNAPTTSPTSGPTDSIYTILTGCVDINVRLTTDSDVDSEESSYNLQSIMHDGIGINGNTIWNETNFVPNSLYDEDACINPVMCHIFYAHDRYGDGMGDLELTYDNQVVYSGSNSYGSALMVPLGSDCSSCMLLKMSLEADEFVINDASSFLLRDITDSDDNQGILWHQPSLTVSQTYNLQICLDPSHCYVLELPDLFHDGIGEVEVSYGGIKVDAVNERLTFGRGCIEKSWVTSTTRSGP